MTKVSRSKKNAPVTLQPKITLSDLLGRWGKFDEAELESITSNADLVTQIQTKYGLDAKQAQTNVDLWANGREF